MAAEFTLEVKQFDRKDCRLGRHVLHDSRSRRFSAPARDPAELKSVRHAVNIPILDQGNVGSCTGHAGTAALASDGFWTAASVVLQAIDPHLFAVGLYSDATALDPWPGVYEPDDTGSDGLSVAKVLHARGLVSGFEHAFSLAATLTALSERVPMIGSNWTSSMFRPDSSGRITVSGSVEGGHEYALDELDVERQRVWLRNSWGPGWGIEGRAWMSWEDLGRLLADNGDCTVLIPKTEPPPEPQPVPPKPKDAALIAALERYLDNKSAYAYMREAGENWLAKELP